MALARSALLLSVAAAPAAGHSGPPFPIVSDRVVGAYQISVWTDPDATDDGTAAGRFWVIVHSTSGVEPSADTRVTVTARPLDRPGAERRAAAVAQQGAPWRHAASVTFDHEGSWKVVVHVEGPLGSVSTQADVAATYDLRPAVGTLPFLLLPFVLIGLLWLKALGRRGAPRASRSRRADSGVGSRVRE